MKLGNLLIVATLLFGSASFAQDGIEGEERECLRMRKIANDAMEFENYKEAVEYFIRGEKICAEFGKDNYDRLISCSMSMVNATEGDESKAYIDTLLGAWERAEAKGFYDQVDDMSRGYYYLIGTTPNYAQADIYLSRGLKTEGKDMNEQFVAVYYYNVYTLWYIEADAAVKEELKQRLITDYFMLSKLINDANFAPKTQEDLTTYMRQVIVSCDDILPMMPTFMENLPEENDSKKTLMLDMANLLVSLECTKSDEFKTLVDALYTLDGNDPEVIVLYLKGVDSPKEKIAAYEKLLENAQTDEDKNKYRYEIALTYFESGSSQTAYNKAKSVGGAQKGSALSIMGQSVAKMANSCGDSTFERKCNYIYAVQLLEQAQANGTGGLSGVISSYKSNYPTPEECFDNNSPSSVSLTCWGVSVSPCN